MGTADHHGHKSLQANIHAAYGHSMPAVCAHENLKSPPQKYGFGHKFCAHVFSVTHHGHKYGHSLGLMLLELNGSPRNKKPRNYAGLGVYSGTPRKPLEVFSLADAELTEYDAEEVVGGEFTGNFAKRLLRQAEFFGQKFKLRSGRGRGLQMYRGAA